MSVFHVIKQVVLVILVIAIGAMVDEVPGSIPWWCKGGVRVVDNQQRVVGSSGIMEAATNQG